MDCPSCGHENPDDAKFCNECGLSLGTPAENTTLPREPSVDSPRSQVVSEQTSSPSSISSITFVNREREIGELVSALDDALAGHGRLVMLVGEPGIGKTRIAQELAAIAESNGAQVFWGRCSGLVANSRWRRHVFPLATHIAPVGRRHRHDSAGACDSAANMRTSRPNCRGCCAHIP